MKARSVRQSIHDKSSGVYRNLCQLTIAGGAAFWATSIATSLLPIAAKYRFAYSNWSIQTVWIGSIFAGIMIGCCVSYILLRFFAKIPTKDPVQKSVVVSTIALLLAILLIDFPMLLHTPADSIQYFFIGVVFNSARFLTLGLAVGYRYKRLCSCEKPQ